MARATAAAEALGLNWWEYRLVHHKRIHIADLDRVSFVRLYEGHVYLDCAEDLAAIERVAAAATRGR